MDLFDAIRLRSSCRAYRPDPVPDDALRQLLEAARLAPSACNRQPWRFAAVREAALRRRVVEEGFLPGLGMRWALDAPVLIVLGMETSFVTHGLGAAVAGVDYPWLDLGIAGEHLVLAATALGLGTCWIGWIRPRRLRALVGWPRAIRPAAVLTLGYPREPAPPPDPAARRKPLDELVTWR
jgi:nitroreductase